MEELEKLSHLLHHWKEHNAEHAETYRAWQDRASSLGRKDLVDVLGRLYQETMKLQDLFVEAEKEIRKAG